MPAFMTFTLPHHRIELRREERLVVTTFSDGSEAHASPHETPEYRAHALEKSGSEDTLLYCWQHDLMHCLVGEMFGGPSPTLWAIAHGYSDTTEAVQADEKRVADLQRIFMMRETP